MALRQLATDLGVEAVLYDSRAHGTSPGQLQELGIADWLRDAHAVVDAVVTSPRVVIVGKSLVMSVF